MIQSTSLIGRLWPGHFALNMRMRSSFKNHVLTGVFKVSEITRRRGLGVASQGSKASALWELLSFIHMSQKYILWLFSVQKAPTSKIISHFYNINDPI